MVHHPNLQHTNLQHKCVIAHNADPKCKTKSDSAPTAEDKNSKTKD